VLLQDTVAKGGLPVLILHRQLPAGHTGLSSGMGLIQKVEARCKFKAGCKFKVRYKFKARCKLNAR
jgi:hypothetical protein